MDGQFKVHLTVAYELSLALLPFRLPLVPYVVELNSDNSGIAVEIWLLSSLETEIYVFFEV